MVLWDFWYFWDYFVKQTDSNVCFLFYICSLSAVSESIFIHFVIDDNIV